MTDKENLSPKTAPEKLFFTSSPRLNKSAEKRRYSKNIPQEFAKIENSITDETESESLTTKKSFRKNSEMILPEIKHTKKVHARKLSDDDIVIYKEDEIQLPPTKINKFKRSIWNLCRCVIRASK